jgi:hypothetical protein
VDEFALNMLAGISGVSAATFNSASSYNEAFVSAIEATLFDQRNPDNKYKVSSVKATDAASASRRKLRELAASDAVGMTWTVTATGNAVNMDDTNAQMISSVNSGDFNGNLAQYAAIAGAPALQTASMEGLESVQAAPAPGPPQPSPASSLYEKAKSMMPLIAGVIGGVVVLVLGGYLYYIRNKAHALVAVAPISDSGALVVPPGEAAHGKLTSVSPAPA